MKTTENKKDKIILNLDIEESLANAIRNSANEIPVLAIEEVEFFKNDSALYDEIIAQRLGLIPLENENLTERDKCSCKGKGCAKCTIQLKINEKGPETVYSGNLKGKAKIIYEKMPIVILIDNQELELVATASLGKGIEHAKYSPGLVYYRNQAICKECYNKDNAFDKDRKIEMDIFKCDLCKKEAKDGTFAGKELVFIIESWGQIDAKKIFFEAIDVLRKNLKELGKKL